MTALHNFSSKLPPVPRVFRVIWLPHTPNLRVGILRSTQLSPKISEVPANV
jgi:hypothetical protein